MARPYRGLSPIAYEIGTRNLAVSMRALLALVLVVLMAVPAGASDPSGATDTTPLAEIIAEVEQEIALYEAAARLTTGVVPLPGSDLAARVEARMVRADYFIGSIRARAHDRIHALFGDGPVGDLIHFVGADDDLSAVLTSLEAAGASDVEMWEAESFLREWLVLQGLVADFRVLVEPGLPERVCPVVGDTWFRDEWQFPRPGGRIHKGVDLDADLGQELRVVEDGIVIQANWHSLGGRQVWYRGDSTGDVYYYAHLEYWPRWLWTGTRLEAGDFVGLAGDSGNAHTPHLHFGWMPGSFDVDLDNLQNPYYLMYELCR
jgi:hypothetical protein